MTSLRPRRATIGLIAATLLTTSVVSASHAAPTDPSPAYLVSKMTGADSISATDVNWKIDATDLGVFWDNGSGQILTAFGDTFGDGFTRPFPNGSDWRSNVLLRSNDTNLADGLSFNSAAQDSPGHAKELIPSLEIDGVEITVIPTAGISVGSRQYMGFMSVKQWGQPGEWDTNYASVAYSDDNGENWITAGGPAWDNPNGDNKFQMSAFERRNGYVYVFATPNGRNGDAHLARVDEDSVLNKSAYEYWTATGWQAGSDDDAVPVVAAPVAELSVQYNDHADKWLMMYLIEDGIVLRSADAPQGPWSQATLVATAADYPGLYGGFMHPWSSGSDVYFALSQWEPYNVYLMRMSIDQNADVVNPNLVADPSFERQPGAGASAPWQCLGNCGIDDQHWSYSGSHNGFVRYNSGWHDIHQTVPVEPHTDYVLTGWLRTSPNNDNGFFGVRDHGGAAVAEANFQSVGTWTRFTVPFNSGPRSSVVLFTGVWTDNGDMWVQVDDYAIVQTP